MISIGKKIPNFTARATSEVTIKSKDLLGKIIILYFYPKDDTPGCTIEGQDFSKNYNKFKKLNSEVFGISRDSLILHEKFKKKFSFPFDLISDESEKLCNLFDVIKEKNMYGKKYMGIERSTFIIDEKQKLFKEWRKVKVKDHVNEVLAAIKDL
ncbi:MAG: peroxiredoxin [Gammaproteobacteria bacterium TMED78]|nr:MAG: peroxiredoxin [Gammaproteobacteria bacterium TMED78]|tara:strand:+ start:14981 stop:15442 length:462 start_codon:yes stop_codon:yes gene_type:complete